MLGNNNFKFKGKYMASVTGIANTGASSKVQESFFTKISKNISKNAF